MIWEKNQNNVGSDDMSRAWKENKKVFMSDAIQPVIFFQFSLEERS